MKIKIYSFLTLYLLYLAVGVSQTAPGKTPKAVFGKPGIRKLISDLKIAPMAAPLQKLPRDLSAINPLRISLKNKYKTFARGINSHITGSPLTSELINAETNAPVMSSSVAENSGSTQQIWSNFLSIDFYENPVIWPPSPTGAVGPTQVIVSANNGIKIFEKSAVTGSPLVTPTGYSGARAEGLFLTLEQFFSPVLLSGSFIADPHIRYDRLSERWFVSAVDYQYNLLLIAMSDNDRITTSSGVTYFAFDSDLFPYDTSYPFPPSVDYARLGIDDNSIIIGANQFGYDSLTNVAYVIDKKKLINGQLVVYPFQLGVANYITGEVYGMYTPQGVYNDNPVAKKSFLSGITYFQNGLVIATLDYDKNNKPRLASLKTVPVEPFNYPRDNSHPGSLINLNQSDTRLLEASMYKNKITGNSHIWTAHAIGVDQSGHYFNDYDSNFVRKARTASRFYQVGNPYNTPYLNQAGTLFDTEESSGRRAVQYFNSSIATSGQGHSVLGGTTNAFNQYTNVFVAGRYHGDAKGTLHKPVKATNTTAMYAPYIDLGFGTFNYVGQWGSYSQTVVDPSDDQTMWTFQEYASEDDSYGVRVVQIKAPPPATPLPFGPLSSENDTAMILNATSVDHSGFFDPGADIGGPGYNRLAVKSTGEITPTEVTFLSPTKLSLKLNTKDKPAGKYFLLISNPDGQIVLAEYTVERASGSFAGQRPSPPSANAADRLAKTYVLASGIYPNPTSGGFNLQVNAAKNFNGKVILINAEGKILSENSMNFVKGSGGVPLSLANANKGNYLAAVYADNVLIAVHKIEKN